MRKISLVILLCFILLGCERKILDRNPETFEEPQSWKDAKEYLYGIKTISPTMQDALADLTLKVKELEEKINKQVSHN